MCRKRLQSLSALASYRSFILKLVSKSRHCAEWRLLRFFTMIVTVNAPICNVIRTANHPLSGMCQAAFSCIASGPLPPTHNGGYYYTNFDLYCQCEADAVPLHGILCLDVTQFSVTDTSQTILVFNCNITHLFYRISSNRPTVLINDNLHSMQAFIWRERRPLYFKLNITAVCVKIVERGGM